MQLFAKFKNILRRGFRATLNFRFLFSCACAYTCVVRVNRDDASTNTRKGNCKTVTNGQRTCYSRIVFMDKMAAGASTDLYERLAEAVRNYPVLYDKVSPHFKDRSKNNLAVIVPLFFSLSKDLPHPSSLWFLFDFQESPSPQ